MDQTKLGKQFHMPDAERLAALGKVTVTHSFLDLVLNRTIKTLAELTPAEADAALASEGSRGLRDIARQLAGRMLGKSSPAFLKFRALLTEAERVTDDRNGVTHGIWADQAGSQALLDLRKGTAAELPTAGALETLATRIFEAAKALNQARNKGGFLHAALNEVRGSSKVKAAKAEVRAEK